MVVPISLIGTFGVMYLCGYSLDNLSLMALTISTGFVVDDAIVVIENISRYLEQGMAPFEAAVRGAREIGFTVVSISVSLIAVFIPILLMGGIVGRLFREFAVTLSAAVAVSMVVSLTTTPMMCAKLLRPEARRAARTLLSRERDASSIARSAGYAVGLAWVLRHSRADARDRAGHARLSVYLFTIIPKGFFPAAGHRPPDGRDPGRPGHLVPGDARSADADSSSIVKDDPAVEHVIGIHRRQRAAAPTRRACSSRSSRWASASSAPTR